MNSADIRAKFFAFFTKQGHTHVPSSPVIPAEDPTLLFTNAGMNQFKDVFLGREQRSYRRAVSIQKCIRAGGKHNDLENVGFTSRHLTFFEMMGNFSFGDYFKKEAIDFAWKFLTEELSLNPNTLWVSVYEHDNDAYVIWQQQIGLPSERIVRLGLKDNFWQMGDTGPCGPCSEIYIDRGASMGCQQKNCAPGCSCDRFLEIWNLVFMQFDRQKNGTDKPLAATGVDTGMGLERLCTVLQNAPSVFETDIFAPIIQKIEDLTGISYANATVQEQAAFRVLADHIRSTAFAIADGGVPAADGRGYVVRKIIRRAALFAHKLSPNLFFPYLVDGLIVSLGKIYPELEQQRNTIVAILEKESEQFSRNLIRGKNLLEQHIAENQPLSELSGALVFTLYDTYGFPLELTKVIAYDHNLSVDEEGFAKEMERQRTLSGLKESATLLSLDHGLTTQFTGYNALTTTAPIVALFDENKQPVQQLATGSLGWIVSSECPFYVESGGQISDQGTVTINGHTLPVLQLEKQGPIIAYAVKGASTILLGDSATMHVDEDLRSASMKNHTSTHLLQAALMKILGKGVKQSGSLVSPDYLRFDFTYPQPLTTEQVDAVELFVNQAIWHNSTVTTRITTLHDAKQHGAIAFFGEKYNPDNVRVVSIGEISSELCGGTHVTATGAIGLFKIIEISSPSTGNRRIVAVTGPGALNYTQEAAGILKTLSTLCKVPEDALAESIEKQRTQLKEAHQLLKRTQRQLWSLQIPIWSQQGSVVNGLHFGVVIAENVISEDARELVQKIVHAKPGLWVFIMTEPHHERINFIISIAPEHRKKYNLKDLLTKLAPLGLRGGGSDVTIQGGAAQLPNTLEDAIKQWIDMH